MSLTLVVNNDCLFSTLEGKTVGELMMMAANERAIIAMKSNKGEDSLDHEFSLDIINERIEYYGK